MVSSRASGLFLQLPAPACSLVQAVTPLVLSASGKHITVARSTQYRYVRRMRTFAHEPAHPLGELIRSRMEEMGWSTADIATRGGMSQRTVQHLAIAPQPLREAPRHRTLTGLAAGLQLPLSLVRAVAAESSGFAAPEVPRYALRLVAALEAVPEKRRGQALRAALDVLELAAG